MIETILNTLTSLFTVTGLFIKRLPDYDQRKKELFYKKQKEYLKLRLEVECEMSLDEWDHKKLLEYMDELQMVQKDINNFIDAFVEELK